MSIKNKEKKSSDSGSKSAALQTSVEYPENFRTIAAILQLQDGVLRLMHEDDPQKIIFSTKLSEIAKVEFEGQMIYFHIKDVKYTAMFYIKYKPNVSNMLFNVNYGVDAWDSRIDYRGGATLEQWRLALKQHSVSVPRAKRGEAVSKVYRIMLYSLLILVGLLILFGLIGAVFFD